MRSRIRSRRGTAIAPPTHLQSTGSEPEPDQGVAGRSARREHQRRLDRAGLEHGARSRLLRALIGPSPAERRRAALDRNWATGARGEELLAEALARRCPEVLALHDRRFGRANIDHIAVAPSGVYVIDTKRHRGKIKVRRPLFGGPSLTIAGRDRTKLIAGLDRQVAYVRAAITDVAPDVPVHGCLCFITPEGFLAEVGLPLLRTLKVNGHPLYRPARLVKRLNRPGPLGPGRAFDIEAVLARRLPPA
ncbi:MAG TPA: nuclease-related domain-containing protein [Solirubrobacteraceae bacterium]|nr:nuclease-related domain-containing protein [Solirubrobacteraceae bacterium]